jgi:hypothetical protein
MSQTKKTFNTGELVWLDVHLDTRAKVYVAAQTSSKLFTFVKYEHDSKVCHEVMTHRLSTILTEEMLQYMSDAMYLPIQYKEIVVPQPFYTGEGNHSVKELEELCRQYSEYAHQQQVIKQQCMKHIVKLKFNVTL